MCVYILNKRVRRYPIVLHLRSKSTLTYLAETLANTHTDARANTNNVFSYFMRIDLFRIVVYSYMHIICELYGYFQMCVCDVKMDASKVSTHTHEKKLFQRENKILSVRVCRPFLPLRLYASINGWARLGLMERIRRQGMLYTSNKMFLFSFTFFGLPFFSFVLSCSTHDQLRWVGAQHKRTLDFNIQHEFHSSIHINFT